MEENTKLLRSFIAYGMSVAVAMAAFIIISNDRLSTLIIPIGGFFIIFLVYRYNSKKVSNLKFTKKITNFEILNIYEDFDAYVDYFDFISGNNVTYNGSEEDFRKIRLFLHIITRNNTTLAVFKRKFLELKSSDSLFFKDFYLYSLHFLLENDIETFVNKFKEYESRIGLRVEQRILNENLSNLKIYKGEIEIDNKLIDMFYDFYGKNKAIDPQIYQYHPKNKLHEYFYITMLYHYLKYTENDKMLSDIEEEYLKFRELTK